MNVTCPKCLTGQAVVEPPRGGSVPATCPKCGHGWLVSARRGSGATLERDLAAMLGVGVTAKPPTPSKPWPATAVPKASAAPGGLGGRWASLPRAARLALGGALVILMLFAGLWLWSGERSAWDALRATYCRMTCDDDACVARCVDGAEVVQPAGDKAREREPKPTPKRRPKRR